MDAVAYVLEVVLRFLKAKGFVLLPWRWVVECLIAGFMSIFG